VHSIETRLSTFSVQLEAENSGRKCWQPLLQCTGFFNANLDLLVDRVLMESEADGEGAPISEYFL